MILRCAVHIQLHIKPPTGESRIFLKDTIRNLLPFNTRRSNFKFKRYMKTSKLNHPAIKQVIAFKVSNGYSQRQIAKELETSQSSIFRMVKRDDVKALIDDEELKLLLQIKEIMEQLQDDPKFKARLVQQIEKSILGFSLS